MRFVCSTGPVHQVEDGQTDELPRPVPEHLFEATVDEEIAIVRVGDAHALVRRLDDATVDLLAPPQRSVRLLAFGDVADRRHLETSVVGDRQADLREKLGAVASPPRERDEPAIRPVFQRRGSRTRSRPGRLPR
jgi:hypothetical protein